MQKVNRDETSKSKLLLAPVAVVAGTAYTPWFDKNDNAEFSEAEYQVILGAAAGSPSSFTVTATVQTSDDKSVISTLDDYTGDDIVAVADTAGTLTRVHFATGTSQRYFRLALTHAFVSGSTPSVITGVVLNVDGARKVPVDTTALATE